MNLYIVLIYIALSLTIVCFAADGYITNQPNVFDALDVNYSALKKSSIGDVLKKPLPINETSRIIKSKQNTYNDIRDKLRIANMPEELIFVAFVESKLSPIKTGQYAGVWQLNAREARKAGLKVGSRKNDERYDYLLATDAFIVNVNRLYKKFGRWDLAILAYNCGEGRLQRAIDKAGSDSLDKLFDPQKNLLPKTSKHVMQQILAYQAAAEELELKEYERYYVENNETN